MPGTPSSAGTARQVMARPLRAVCWSVDRSLMEVLALLSSSERARVAAAAWLAAFDAAWAAGAREEQAHAHGFAAWRAEVGRQMGVQAADSRMLAPNPGCCRDARPPPIAPC